MSADSRREVDCAERRDVPVADERDPCARRPLPEPLVGVRELRVSVPCPRADARPPDARCPLVARDAAARVPVPAFEAIGTD